jgi:hypothetical protein
VQAVAGVVAVAGGLAVTLSYTDCTSLRSSAVAAEQAGAVELTV